MLKLNISVSFSFAINLISVENLTKEEFSGNFRNKTNLLNTSRDTLNPQLNLENLKNRLNLIEYYKNLHGIEHAYWPHYALGNIGRHLYRYKFNYAIKGLFAFQLYKEIQNYRHLNRVSFMPVDQQMSHFTLIGWAGLLTTGIFLYI
jgi:hypothetical protein